MRGHLIRYSEDEKDEIAKTILVFMLKPMFGKPAFVCRMIPIFKISVQILQESIIAIAKIVHEANGSVCCLICDNHPINRKTFSEFHLEGQSSWKGSILPESEVFLLNDPVHLFKSIRNNWMTEKNGILSLKFRDNAIIGKWQDIVQLYNSEKMNVVKLTRLSHKAVHPTSLERQHVSFMANALHEKTVAALRPQQRETSELLNIFVQMWNMINIKRKDSDIRLNDVNRAPFLTTSDSRFDFMIDFANAINLMPGGKGWSRQMSLTSETKLAVANTVNGLVELMRLLLSEDHQYVLPGIFQTGRLEGEFGVYRRVEYSFLIISLFMIICLIFMVCLVFNLISIIVILTDSLAVETTSLPLNKWRTVSRCNK